MKSLTYTVGYMCLIATLLGTSIVYADDTVTIGGVFNISGWAEGEKSKTAAEFAVNDFNEYLDMIGADWDLKMRIEDTQDNANIALSKLQDLRGSGVDLVVGVAFSHFINLAYNYIQTNDILVISHAAQAANQEIDDNVFRLVPNDGQQVPAISAAVQDANVTTLITISYIGSWGDGIVDGVESFFDGEVVKLIRYDYETADYSAVVSFLDAEVAKLVDEHGADSVGVLFVGGDEILQIAHQLKLYENAHKVRWFGTNNQAGQSYFHSDLIMREFAETTKFTAVRSIPAQSNSIGTALDERFIERYNSTASIYNYAAYDAVWLLGMTILQTQSTDSSTLIKTIPAVALHTIGASGHLELSPGGDLANAAFEIWRFQDGIWITYADYIREPR